MLCPFGAMQEFMYSLVPYRLAPSQKLMLWASRIKFLTLFAVICAFFAFGFKAALMTEPFGAVFEFSASRYSMAFAVTLLLASGIYKRFFCRCLCPSGACLHAVAKTSAALQHFVGKRHSVSVGTTHGRLLNGWRDILFVLLLLLALSAMAGVGMQQHYEIAQQEGKTQAEQRKFEKVNVERIREGVYNKKLSDIKAKYWKTADEDE